MQRTPEISVIIPALNEEKYIHNALGALRHQTFKNFETIVVDGGSKDATRKIVESYGARVIVEKRRGIGRARNRGAALAKGNILVFLDADTKPSATLLSVYHNAFRTSRIVAATGPIKTLEKAPRRVRMGYKFVSELFVKSSILVGRPSLVGLNFAVRRDAFMKVGGFNDKYVTYEDWDLSLRLGKKGRIKFLENAVVKTSVRRINAWGVHGFFSYYIGNMARYHLFKKPKKDYNPIR